MKKRISYLMILALVMLSIAGCQNQASQNQATQSTPGDVPKEAIVPGSLPIVSSGQNVTLTAFAKQDTKVNDFENNEFTKWVTEKTNVKFKFITSQASDSKTKLNLMLNSGDYPDMIWSDDISTSQMSLYGTQNIFVPLNDLYDKYGNNIKKIFEQYPKSRTVCTALDGKIYALPYINDAYHVARNGRMWVYMPWVGKLNLKIPTTTDEFYEFLKAIKNGDPNGNGKADEIPLGACESNYMNKLEYYFMNSFMIFPDAKLWLDDNKKIQVCYTADGYKKGMKYLTRLYKEGLILKDFFSISKDEAMKIGENPDVPLMGAFPGHGPDDLTKKAGESGRFYEYLTIPPLKGPDGVRNAFYRGKDAGIPKFFITNKCKNPEVAFRVADFLYDPEATRNAYIGLKGKAWDWAEKGTLSVNGEQAVFSMKYPYATQEMNTSWMVAGNVVLDDQFNITQVATGVNEIMNYLKTRNVSLVPEMKKYTAYNEAMKYYEAKTNYDPYKFDEKYIVPPILYNDKEAAELADLKAVIDPYVNEMFARFVIGDTDIDSGWDKYTGELNRIGLKRLVDIMQTAYDRQYKK